jgi:nucleotide-binding universal stress UspA family protein
MDPTAGRTADQRTPDDQRGPVVVGVDGSADSREAVRLGAREARDRGAALDLVLAFPWRDTDTVPAPEGFDGRAVLLVAAGLALDGVVPIARAEFPGGVVTTRVVVGRAVDVLAEESARARLLCLGSRGTGAVTDLVLGSTTAALVQLSRCPVLAVPLQPGTSVTDRRDVVVGVAGEAGDAEVLGYGLAAASARGCGVVAVHTWSPALPGLAGRLLAHGSEVAARRRAEAVLDAALDGLPDRSGQVPVRRVVAPGPAAAVLLSAALTAELVVIGHRHRALRGLGSVAAAVLHRSGCPVTVVPQGVPGSATGAASGVSRTARPAPGRPAPLPGDRSPRTG